MVYDLFFCAIPVKFFPFTISAYSHYTGDRMPESGMNIPIGYDIPIPHTINPVIEVVRHVVTHIYRAKFQTIFFSGDNFCFSAFYCLFHPFIKIKASGKVLVLGNIKPSGTTFSTMRK